MEKIRIREDNKKVYKLAYIIVGVVACVIAYINIMNTMNLLVLYSLFASTAIFLIGMIILLIVKRKRNTVEISYEAHQLLFYQSNYKNNKRLKLLIVLFDALGLISLISLSLYFYFKMDFVRVYDFYGLIVLGAVGLFLVFILIKDIVTVSKIDRYEVRNSSLNLFSYDKKFLLGFVMLLIGAFNIGILSFNIPHFKVLWTDLLIFELIGLLTTIIYLLNLYTTSKYYSYFSFKKIDEIAMDTEILEVIGKGLFASVYKAYLPSLDKVFAIKKLESNEVADIERFENEFKLMKSLDHQNLLSVYSYNEVKLEYVMDYADYRLKDYIETNAIDLNKRLLIINQFLDGMEYLHNHGIIHRDLSLANVMIKRISEDEIKVVITDFGLAKGERSFTKTKTSSGYQSTIEDPALPALKYETVQSDIYAIGYIMNFIINSQTSIKDNNDYLSRIIIRCVELNLDKRYHSVSEIKEELSKGELA